MSFLYHFVGAMAFPPAFAEKCVKGPLAMRHCLMYVNCVERGHQLELAVCTCCAFIYESGKPVVCTRDPRRGYC